MFELTPYFRSNRKAAQVYDPFREMEDMERRFFGNSVQSFRSDIKDEGNAYLIETDMPGFRKEDIHVDLKGETLTIRAERHSDYEKDDKKKSYLHVERSYGSYERSFDVSGIKLDAITVSYTDGVLSITLPKEEVKQSESRSLEVK